MQRGWRGARRVGRCLQKQVGWVTGSEQAERGVWAGMQ